MLKGTSRAEVMSNRYFNVATRSNLLKEFQVDLKSCNYISEGSVSHINGVRPGFLELQLVGREIIRIRSTCACAHAQGILIKIAMLSHLWPFF